MGQISKFLRRGQNDRLLYWCQGCEEAHQVQVGDGPGPRWGYNGNPDKPTFTPSVLVTWNEGRERVERRCHTFITNGMVQFLDDCTHALAAQTLPLPELPPHLQDTTP